MANTEFTTINETPVRVTLTPYEMKTLISSLKHSLETNPQFVQIVPPGETVIVISFQLKLFCSMHIGLSEKA